jgi:hypothetical protein
MPSLIADARFSAINAEARFASSYTLRRELTLERYMENLAAGVVVRGALRSAQQPSLDRSEYRI